MFSHGYVRKVRSKCKHLSLPQNSTLIETFGRRTQRGLEVARREKMGKTMRRSLSRSRRRSLGRNLNMSLRENPRRSLREDPRRSLRENPRKS